jgi:signal transduction histidine kinase/CheY-like chemotaxis protein
MDPVVASRPEPPPADDRATRLERDLAAAVEQQRATSDVLETIGRATFELDPVFETVLRHAVHLCGADAGQVWQREGDEYRLATALGGSDEYRRFLAAHPIAKGGAGTVVGRVGVERRTVQIADALTDPAYRWREAQSLGGFRSLLGVPMLAGERVVGVIALWRAEVAPFDERTIEIVGTFAAQGAIAIQNVHLFRQLEQRSADLARSVDELRVLGEVSQAVSSSLDLDRVLTTIVRRAVELSGADGGSIFRFRPASAEFALRACFGTSEALAERLREITIPLGETFIGRAASAGEVRQATDFDLEPPDPHIVELRRHGWRSMVAVPLRREDEILGSLVIRRKVTGAFDPRTIDLLETLASQSAVAIHNARVFRELEEKTSELEVASRHKSEFLASMSHELRTPLNAVIGFADVLLDRLFGELNERQDEYVRDIRDSGRHLLELINEILDLSKIEAGRMELELGSIAVAEMLEHGVAMVRERAARKGIALTLDVAADVGAARADELKLKQVVLNLLTNAIKFTPDGGSVRVAASAADDEVVVAVSDTGIGIADDERERIFEAFQRGGRGARQSTEGTGLGLTLSRRIVELHGGRLWMESTLGAGSTFSFAVPAAPRAPAAPPAPAGSESLAPPSPATGGEPSGTVLVVEDDARSADLLRVYLEGAGHEVAVARDGIEGLELARRTRPRAVVLDVLLPRLDGWELLARLKRDADTAAVPVVIVSMLDERGAGFALGAAEYLVKPVDRDALLTAVSRCLERSGDGRTVVAIDDEALDLDLVEAALTPHGWSVARATNGEDGVELVRRERPSVVLLDLLMPGMDGFAVVERLRADPVVADVPIVVLTAKDMTAADRARLNGRISFLARKGTFREAELAALVSRLSAAGAGGRTTP